MKNSFPRVLVVGQSFELVTGGGITLSNLFTGWPKASLANAATILYPPNWEVCDQYYDIGALETPLIPPLGWVWPYRRYSGPLTRPEKPERASTSEPKVETGLIKYIHQVSASIGFQEIIRRIHISSRLRTWVEHFQPELLYTQAASLHAVRLTQRLADMYQIPYVIHMMDDWPSTLYADKLLSTYLRWRVLAEFEHLLKGSSGFLGISPKMCTTYQARYGYACIPFQNTLDLDAWKKHARHNSWKVSSPFVLMYRGRVGKSIDTSLIDIADAVQQLYQQGIALRFDIYITPACNELTRKRYERADCVFVHQPGDFTSVPSALAAADLLVLCYDFDPGSIEFIRYSLPTKAPEYMASGTAILVYAPPGMAITEYASQGWGYTVLEKNQTNLQQAILQLMNDDILRETLGKRAQELVLQNHESQKVRDAFRQTLADAKSRIFLWH